MCKCVIIVCVYKSIDVCNSTCIRVSESTVVLSM